MRAILRGELIKMRCYRFSWWFLPLGLLFMTGASFFSLEAAKQLLSASEPADSILRVAATTPASGAFLGGILSAILVAVIIAADYSSGSINVTFMAVPQRSKVVGAKILLAVLVILVLGVTQAVITLIMSMLMLPAAISRPMVASSAFWINTGASLAIMGVWAAMTAVTAVAFRRGGLAVGTVVALMMATPVLIFGLRSWKFKIVADVLETLPMSIVNTAAINGNTALPWLTPIMALGLCLFWIVCCVVLAVKMADWRRSVS